MDSVLALERLEKVYRPGLFKAPVCALRGLDLAVRRGEIYGLAGPNGAGKTTTFKILLGLLRPSAGTGSLLRRPLGDLEARRRLGFLPELPAYPPHLTVAELLRLGRALSGVRPDGSADRRLLESLGLGGQANRPIRRLSKGQLQRAGLAQALVHEPEFLILDEPMSGLDPLGRGLVKDLLRRVRGQGRTVLFSSHVLADVEALADTVGILAEGRMLAEGSPSELLAGTVREVRIEGAGDLPSEVLAGMPRDSQVAHEAGAWSVRLARPEPYQVDACLRRLLRADARIHGVETAREDLEAFFLRRLEPEDGRERRSA